MTVKTPRARKPASPRAKTLRLNLREDVAYQPAPLKVDRKAGVVYHVKICGWKSANGREYTAECLTKARPLYEGCKVYCDHPEPDKREQVRKSHDALGIFRNVTLEAEGLYGDLHCLTSHVMAQRVFEDAEKRLGVFGMSHNCEASCETSPNGLTIVNEITQLESVDLVTDGATVKNLSESRKTMKKITFGQLLENYSSDKRLAKKVRAKLLEDDAYGGADNGIMDAEVDEPQADTDPMTAIKSGFMTALQPLIDKALDGDMDAAKQVQDYIKTHQKMAGKGKPAGKTDDVEEDEGEQDDEGLKEAECEKKKMEARLKAASTITEAKAKSLCKLAGVTADATLLESLIGTEETKALKLLEWAKEHGTANAKPAGRNLLEDAPPRSSGSFMEALDDNGKPAADTNGKDKKILEFKGDSPEKIRENTIAFLRGSPSLNGTTNALKN